MAGVWEYCSRGIFSTQLVYGTLSFGWGLFLGGWRSPWSLILGIVAYELFMILVWKCSWRVHVLGALYYILGWIVGRAIFQDMRGNIFKSKAEPWLRTDHFKTYLEKDYEKLKEGLYQPFLPPGKRRKLKEKDKILRELKEA